MSRRLDALAEAAGLRSYDTALPADWVDEVRSLTGIDPAGEVVWCYDDALFGRPVALTPAGEDVLARHAAALAGGAAAVR